MFCHVFYIVKSLLLCSLIRNPEESVNVEYTNVVSDADINSLIYCDFSKEKEAYKPAQQITNMLDNKKRVLPPVLPSCHVPDIKRQCFYPLVDGLAKNHHGFIDKEINSDLKVKQSFSSNNMGAYTNTQCSKRISEHSSQEPLDFSKKTLDGLWQAEETEFYNSLLFHTENCASRIEKDLSMAKKEGKEILSRNKPDYSIPTTSQSIILGEDKQKKEQASMKECTKFKKSAENAQKIFCEAIQVSPNDQMNSKHSPDSKESWLSTTEMEPIYALRSLSLHKNPSFSRVTDLWTAVSGSVSQFRIGFRKRRNRNREIRLDKNSDQKQQKTEVPESVMKLLYKHRVFLFEETKKITKLTNKMELYEFALNMKCKTEIFFKNYPQEVQSENFWLVPLEYKSNTRYNCFLGWLMRNPSKKFHGKKNKFFRNINAKSCEIFHRIISFHILQSLEIWMQLSSNPEKNISLNIYTSADPNPCPNAVKFSKMKSQDNHESVERLIERNKGCVNLKDLQFITAALYITSHPINKKNILAFILSELYEFTIFAEKTKIIDKEIAKNSKIVIKTA